MGLIAWKCRLFSELEDLSRRGSVDRAEGFADSGGLW